MSTTTTSASSLSATARATVAPTFPAPPTTVTFRFMQLPSMPQFRNPASPQSHVADDAIAELGAFDFSGSLHQPREIVGDRLCRNGAVHALDDQIRGLAPAHVTQHHFARQNHRSRVHLVLVGVLGRGAVSGFEHGVAGDVIDVAAG